MYLGELSKLTAEAVLRECGRALPRRLEDTETFSKTFSFTTPMMVDVEAGTEQLDLIAEAFSLDEERDRVPLRDLMEVLRLVCPFVSARAGQLVGAALASVLATLPLPPRKEGCHRRVAVAVDGSMYVNYPRFRESLHRTVSTLFANEDDDVVVDIDACRDGSGFGAAVVAACANESTYV